MINIESTLIARKPLEEVWLFFNRIDDLARCVPTHVRHEVIDENTVDCDLRLRLGIIPLDNKVRMSITERQEGKKLVAKGVSEAGDYLKKFGKVATNTVTHLSITLTLEQVADGETSIHYIIRADAVGQMKRIYDSIIKGQRDKLERQFIENVKKVLGCSIVKENAALSL